MADKSLIAKVANVPMAKPGFEALDMAAPILMKLNPQGKFETCKPGSLDDEKLKAVVSHLIGTKAVGGGQGCCCQCVADAQKAGTSSNYVPVIMMPIYAADDCPFDLDCEIRKMKKEAEAKPAKKKTAEPKAAAAQPEKGKDKKKKKQGYVLQRFTDFDLMSQW